MKVDELKGLSTRGPREEGRKGGWKELGGKVDIRYLVTRKFRYWKFRMGRWIMGRSVREISSILRLGGLTIILFIVKTFLWGYRTRYVDRLQ